MKKMKKKHVNFKKLVKKGIACFCSLAMVVSVAPFENTTAAVDTQNLPFKLMAPTGTALSWANGSDSPTTMSYSYSKNSDSGMSEFLAKLADPETEEEARQEIEDCGYGDISVVVQIDWAIDDPENGWHYTQYWDTNGKAMDATGSYRSYVSCWDVTDLAVYPETNEEQWIMRGIYGDFEDTSFYDWYGSSEDSDNGYSLGLKEQLKDGQYTINDPDENYDYPYLTIDYDKHTVYARSRFGVVATPMPGTAQNTEYFYSEWSETAAYGKAAKAWEPYTKDTLDPPDVSNLRYNELSEENDPYAIYNLNVPVELEKGLAEVTARGGSLYIEIEMRPEGEDEWTVMEGERDIKSGDMSVELRTLTFQKDPIAEGTKLEFRARYFCSQYESYGGDQIGDFYTDYSRVLTMESPYIPSDESQSSDESPAPSEEPTLIPAKNTEEPVVVPTTQPIASAVPVTVTMSPTKSAVNIGTATAEPAISSLDSGASKNQVEKFITALTNDDDPAGTSFGFLFGRQKKATKDAITLTWIKPENAASYTIYGAKCGKANQYQMITSVSDTTYTQTSLPSGTYHKYLIAAFDAGNKLLGVSNTIHITTKGGKYCNFKKIKTNAKKNKVTLAKAGKKFKVKATAVKESKKLKVDVHRPIRYESNDKEIATVANNGKIVAKKKGSCEVYVFAQNGVYQKLKVTVKK